MRKDIAHVGRWSAIAGDRAYSVDPHWNQWVRYVFWAFSVQRKPFIS